LALNLSEEVLYSFFEALALGIKVFFGCVWSSTYPIELLCYRNP